MKTFAYLSAVLIGMGLNSGVLAKPTNDHKMVVMCQSFDDPQGAKKIQVEIFSRPNPYKDLDCEFDVFADIKTIEKDAVLFQQRFLVYNYTKYEKQIEHFYGDAISIQVRLKSPNSNQPFTYGSIRAQMEYGPNINRNLKCHWLNPAPGRRTIRDSQFDNWDDFNNY